VSASEQFFRAARVRLSTGDVVKITGAPIVDSQPLKGIAIDGLRCTFTVEKTKTPEPNTVKLAIFNLAESTRKKIPREGGTVVIEAGYRGAEKIIFAGHARIAYSTQEDTNWVTHVEAGDGEKEMRESRVNLSLKGPVKANIVATKLAEALGVKIDGAVKKKINESQFRKALTDFTQGYQAFGYASSSFDNIMKSLGFEWSVQDGSLHILKIGESLTTKQVDINPKTGLIGSPEMGQAGHIKFKCLLNPEIKIGVKTFVTCKQLPKGGLYRTEKIVYSGDTHGTDWFAEVSGVSA
jgi:hypothetical protein